MLSLFLMLFNSSCENTNNNSDVYKEGTLKDLSGLDGCGWIIELNNNTKLEPINLNLFDLELVENKKVEIKYIKRTDLGSFCMVGQIIEIEEIKNIKKIKSTQVLTKEWQLQYVIYYNFNGKDSSNCLNDSVTYHFKNNNTLEVKGNSNCGYESGVYSYTLAEYDSISNTFNLTIKDDTWNCQLNEKELILSLAYLDGGILNFKELKD